MIQRPTVLILGAGASLPSGYPLGEGLVKGIVSATGHQQELYRLLLQYEPFVGLLRGFHGRLAESDTASIDDFLEANPDLAAIGKVSIAGLLTIWGPAHNARDEEFFWYHYLWRLLHQGAPTLEAFRQNQLKVITYNYDRSLERYLIRVARHNYPELARRKDGSEAAADFLSEAIPVVHLHGSLGEGGDAVINAPDRSVYKDIATLFQIAAGIRIVHEEQPTEEYGLAQEWLRTAERIYFIGFGYHPTNLKRLDLLGQIQGRPGVTVAGSAYGMMKAEIDRAETALKIGSSILKPGAHALRFLREFAPL
jgi:hypothetical protein